MSDKKSLEKEYKELLETIEHYPAQIRQSWDEVWASEISEDYKNLLNIVVCGMGGSTLGARMLKSLLYDRLRVPIDIVNDYHLPYYAGERTLVILSSYSGGTEEPISCSSEALNKNVKAFGITTGGKLAEIIKTAQITSYIFDPKNNPSGQPRNATGYFIGSLLALFSKLGLVDVSESEVLEAIDFMNKLVDEVKNPESDYSKRAFEVAKNLEGKIPVLVSSEHLYETAHIFKNQLNESAKTFSVHFPIPELNHHLMEGLKHPKKQKDILFFVFFESSLYSERIQKRYQLTEEVVSKNSIPLIACSLTANSKIAQTFEMLVFGSLVVKNLAQLYQVNPSKIPWVDYFKEKLKNG